MTDVVEQQTAVETVEKKEEEAAPALPTTEPPKDEAVETPAAAKEEEKPADEAAAEEKKEEKKAEKVVEPPKDPREDPVGWLGQQIPQAVHIVNHQMLDWAQKFAIEDEAKRAPLPGKNGAVTRRQFLSFLSDGTLLANMAKKCGAPVETIHEGEAVKNNKENQTANIQVFADWAKQNLGLPEDKIVSAADLLEKGKAGYPQVFEAVWATGSQAVEKFGATTGIDIDSVVVAASQAVKTNFIQNFMMNIFKRARTTPQLEKKAALEAEEAEKKAEKAAAAEKLEEVVEEECKKADPVPTPAVVEAN